MVLDETLPPQNEQRRPPPPHHVQRDTNSLLSPLPWVVNSFRLQEEQKRRHQPGQELSNRSGGRQPLEPNREKSYRHREMSTTIKRI